MLKKNTAFLLLVVIIMSALLPSVYASDSAKEDNELYNTVHFECSFDTKERQVTVSGTVNHDVMIEYSDYTVNVYSILPNSTYEALMSAPDTKPLASSAMSVKFTFVIDADSMLQRYSRYAVVFTSPEGENYLAGSPLMPSVSSDYEYRYGDKSAYKGLLLDSAYELGESGAGTVIVDVDLERAVGDISDSILYPMDDTYIYMNKTYISDIDRKVRTASVLGSRVYLRFLFGAQSGETYTVPDVYSETELDKIYAISGFFAERYDGTSGSITGMIIGKCIDDVSVANYIGGMSLDEYADIYTMYLVVVASAARSVNSKLDMVVPFTYTINSTDNDAEAVSPFLEKIAARLSANVSGSFSYSLMLESNDVPTLGYTAGVSDHAAYISSLSSSYKSIPLSIMYMWNVPKDLRGKALCACYVYTYYSLIENGSVSSFTVSFDDAAKVNYSGLKNVLRYIDTADSEDITEELASYFEVDTWEELFDELPELPTLRTVINENTSSDKPSGILGEFCYVDFSEAASSMTMIDGHNCTSLRSAYDEHGVRSLSAVSSAMDVGDVMEFITVFEYPESYLYTKYLSVVLSVSDISATETSVYEIYVTFGNQSKRITAKGAVGVAEETELFFDVSEFSADSMASYVKISVRSLTGDTEGLTLWLHDINGYSEEYDSERLAELIEAQRLQIRNKDANDDERFDITRILTIVGVVFVVVAVSIVLFLIFRRDDDDETKG